MPTQSQTTTKKRSIRIMPIITRTRAGKVIINSAPVLKKAVIPTAVVDDTEVRLVDEAEPNLVEEVEVKLSEAITDKASIAVAVENKEPNDDDDFDLDKELSNTVSLDDRYGGDIGAALANLYKLTAKEGVDLKTLREGFIEVNKILLANPALVTEIMLPEHLGQICEAAKKLTNIAFEVGTARQSKASANKTAKAQQAKDIAKTIADLGLDDPDSEF
jgi:hypothetical protein